MDFLTPSLLLGQVIGRFANFFNYESYGGPTSVFWKMYVPDSANFYENLNQKFFHPTFLYEIIPNFILLLVLLWNYRGLTKRKAGLVFGFYALGYGIIRFFVEFFRLDALVIELPKYFHWPILSIEIHEIRVSQLAALFLMLVGLIVLKFRSEIVYIRKSMIDLKVKKDRRIKV
ncbi:MAG: prolipoprotein diacylglyceryl transferase [Thermales bacterium]|nr:prolipoprotein diacylglyceryl transferase [Thermales bacterium]